MSTEAANAKRFSKGLTVLTPLEGELLEALEELSVQIQQVNDGDRPYTGFDTELIDHGIAKAHGETE